MKQVAIYRHQLFKPSEPFIHQQAGCLNRFRPVYVGRELAGPPPRHAAPEDCLILTRQPVRRGQVAAHVLTRHPGLYARLLAQRPVDLIHAHFAVDALYALEVARRLDVPLITTFHGFDVTTHWGALLRSRKVSWTHYALFRRKLFRRGDRFIAVSHFIRERAVRLGVPEEKLVTHYIGVDTEAIRPPERRPSDGFTVLHVARLVEKKGTAYLIRAFRQVARRFPDARLVIIGDGPLRRPLEDLAESLGVDGRVSFLGTLPHRDVLDWMGRADVLCLPSVAATSGDSEGLGMVLLEAAATGVPVIGTRHGGIPEAVVDEVTGFLVPEKSAADLAERLTYLAEHPTARVRMGREARNMAVERFDLKKQTEKLERIYDDVL